MYPTQYRTAPAKVSRGYQVFFQRKTGAIEPTRYGIFRRESEAKRFAAIASLRTKSIVGFKIKATGKMATESLRKNLPQFQKVSKAFVRRGEFYVESPKKSRKKSKKKVGFGFEGLGIKTPKFRKTF